MIVGIRLLVFLTLAIFLTLILGPLARSLFFWILWPFHLPKDLIEAWSLTPYPTPELRFPDPFSEVPALLFASYLMIRLWERRPFSTLGLSFLRWGHELSLGIFLAGIYVFVLTIFLRLANIPLPITIEENPLTYMEGLNVTQILGVGLGFSLAIILASSSEELLFRGYLFQTLLRVFGPWPTIFLTSALFGLAHLATHRIPGVIGAGTIGLVLGVAYWRVKSLWLLIGFHASVNWLGNALVVAGLVKGLAPGEEYPVWMSWYYTGIAVAASLPLLGWIGWKLKPHPTMEALWKQHVLGG